MSDLLSHLRDTVRAQIEQHMSEDEVLFECSELRLVPLVGNGLSRIAAARASQNDKSFFSLVRDLAERARLPPVEHLRARGFTLDEIFRQAITSRPEEKAKAVKEIYRSFGRSLRPSPLHLVLARLARAFLTTNYDPLIELALLEVGRYNERHWHAVTMAKHSTAQVLPKCEPGPELACVYKLHGSFPGIHQNRRQPLTREFTMWLRDNLRDNNLKSLIIEDDSYNYWAYECSDADFKHKFEGPLELFSDPHNFILVIGHGLGHEERILFRIRDIAFGRPTPAAIGVVPTFESERDAPISRMGTRFTRILIPPGLAASSVKRELAYLVVLEQLVDLGVLAHSSELRQEIDRVIENDLPIVEERTLSVALPHVSPKLVSLGQVAYHTLRGYEDAPSQERAYSPCKASWSPINDLPKPLESSEPFGDGLVPCLLWDALGIPSALGGRLACDNPGRIVFDYLTQNTELLDFRLLDQDLLLGSDRQPTETATVACWMDLRLILDGPRFIPVEDLQRWTTGDRKAGPSRLNRVVAPRPQTGRVIYSSKAGLHEAVRSLQRSDLLIFDTGNNCRADVLEEALRSGSVIIASALSFHLYLQTMAAALSSNPKVLQDAWEKVRKEFEQLEPTNETGRYFQMAELLRFLERTRFSLELQQFQSRLVNAVAISISLGPLGVLWWRGSALDQPRWTRIEPSHPRTTSELLAGQCLPFAQIRNALGCGDSGRAGFAAAIALSEAEPADLVRAPGSRWSDDAVGKVLRDAFTAMVWAGGSRVMFWSALDFGRWLRDHRKACRDWLADPSGPPSWPDGAVGRQLITTDLQGTEADVLMSFVQRWETEILSDPPRVEDRRRQSRTEAWLCAISEWRKARGLPEMS